MYSGTSVNSSGLAAFVKFARLRGFEVDENVLVSQLGTRTIGLPEMWRAAGLLGVDAKIKPASWPDLAGLTVPAIASLRDGGFLIAARILGENALVQDPLLLKPQVLTRSEFEARWDGTIFLMAADAAEGSGSDQGKDAPVSGGETRKLKNANASETNPLVQSIAPSSDPHRPRHSGSQLANTVGSTAGAPPADANTGPKLAEAAGPDRAAVVTGPSDQIKPGVAKARHQFSEASASAGEPAAAPAQQEAPVKPAVIHARQAGGRAVADAAVAPGGTAAADGAAAPGAEPAAAREPDRPTSAAKGVAVVAGNNINQLRPPEQALRDMGLAALVMLARFLGVAADAEQIRHQLGTKEIGVAEMLRAARQLGLKARVQGTNYARLAKAPLPGIAVMRNGEFLIIGKVGDEKILVQSPLSNQPIVLTREDFEAAWTGQLFLIARRVGLTHLTRRFDITWFLGAIHKYRKLFGEVLLASFALQLLGLVTPLFFQVIIDKVLVHRGMSTLDVLIIALIAVSAIEGILGGLRTFLFSHTTNRVDVELGARLFNHLLALPLNYFQARRAGDSVARVRELENIRNFITSSALTLVIDLFFTVLFIAVMFLYSPLLTWIVIAAFPFYIGISAGLTPIFRRRLEEKFDRGAENQAFLVESVNGVETLKAMAVEPQMQRRWEEQLASYVSASFRVTNLGNWANQAVQVLSKTVMALTLYFGAKLVIAGDLTVGELVAFNILSGRVSAPVLRLAQIWQDFHQARVSVARLGDILNTVAEPTFSHGRTTLPTIQGNITFEHVSFRYRPDGPQILHDVNIGVGAGQVVGIVGSSGSGKSTMAKLLQRLYVPESGRILVDGVDLALVDLAWLRRQIGVVLQDNILFNRTVRDNIALADPTFPLERIITAAKLAGAHDFILELPESYDTLVGERGSTLSGGQRQRIAIARALVTNPRILVFDEATSALDYESERIIQENMRDIVKGRTVLIIAHRLSTVRRADRIITIERGRIVEDGSHDELMRSGGRYAKLHYLQAGIHDAH